MICDKNPAPEFRGGFCEIRSEHGGRACLSGQMKINFSRERAGDAYRLPV